MSAEPSTALSVDDAIVSVDDAVAEPKKRKSRKAGGGVRRKAVNPLPKVANRNIKRDVWTQLAMDLIVIAFKAINGGSEVTAVTMNLAKIVYPEMAFAIANTVNASRKKKADENPDDPKPKLPSCGFILFQADNRPDITLTLQKGENFTHKSSEIWASYNEEQKKPYNDRYLKLKESYNERIAAWTERQKLAAAAKADADGTDETDAPVAVTDETIQAVIEVASNVAAAATAAVAEPAASKPATKNRSRAPKKLVDESSSESDKEDSTPAKESSDDDEDEDAKPAKRRKAAKAKKPAAKKATASKKPAAKKASKKKTSSKRGKKAESEDKDISDAEKDEDRNVSDDD